MITTTPSVGRSIDCSDVSDCREVGHFGGLLAFSHIVNI